MYKLLKNKTKFFLIPIFKLGPDSLANTGKLFFMINNNFNLYRNILESSSAHVGNHCIRRILHVFIIHESFKIVQYLNFGLPKYNTKLLLPIL